MRRYVYILKRPRRAGAALLDEQEKSRFLVKRPTLRTGREGWGTRNSRFLDCVPVWRFAHRDSAPFLRQGGRNDNVLACGAGGQICLAHSRLREGFRAASNILSLKRIPAAMLDRHWKCSDK